MYRQTFTFFALHAAHPDLVFRWGLSLLYARFASSSEMIWKLLLLACNITVLGAVGMQ